MGQIMGSTWQDEISVSTFLALIILDFDNSSRMMSSSYNNPQSTASRVLASLEKERGEVLFNPAFFETLESQALKAKVRMVKPVIDFQTSGIRLGYNVGTRGNGHDSPRWPEDLMQEEIK